MGYPSVQSIWAIAREQHGVVTRGQLLERGYSSQAIHHRVTNGRLFPVHRCVYALGRPQLTQYGHWMAAVLTCGPEAGLAGMAAAALYEIWASRHEIEVCVPAHVRRRREGIIVHRRSELDVTSYHGIPATPPIDTLVDIAPRLTPAELEAAISAADKRNLVDPEALRAALDDIAPRPGVAVLRDTLDRRTFRLTDSELERTFIPLSVRAGLGVPCTRRWVNGYKVDFYWPHLNLVVETDGLTYHRTPAQQAADQRRDQAHAAAGTERLRFTHGQVAYEPTHTIETLSRVGSRLLRTADSWQTPP
jgi:very-short-patch-repair endonuclease